MPNGPMPPTPTRFALAAYAILLPFLILAVLTSPFWAGALGALKLAGLAKTWLARVNGRAQRDTMGTP